MAEGSAALDFSLEFSSDFKTWQDKQAFFMKPGHEVGPGRYSKLCFHR